MTEHRGRELRDDSRLAARLQLRFDMRRTSVIHLTLLPLLATSAIARADAPGETPQRFLPPGSTPLVEVRPIEARHPCRAEEDPNRDNCYLVARGGFGGMFSRHVGFGGMLGGGWGHGGHGGHGG